MIYYFSGSLMPNINSCHLIPAGGSVALNTFGKSFTLGNSEHLNQWKPDARRWENHLIKQRQRGIKPTHVQS